MSSSNNGKAVDTTNTIPIVHIIDDDLAVLDSLHMLFNSIDIANCTYHSAIEFIEKFQNPAFNKQTGCIVLDIRMPKMSGMDCHKKLIQMNANLPVIFLTGHGDIALAVEAMKNGALDFIEKPFREQQLIESVQTAIQKSIYKSRRQQSLKQIREKLNSLTPREAQILSAIVDGKANKVIALELHLSERTIELHRAHVMEKMQAKSLAHLIRMYLDVSSS